ncbi:MAG TPA: type II toxin-antitoxin system HicB family antitoxin [Dehalococcoidia bacterium]|jgi:predicted RNase H-like HicB family nuclease|nr:type II toxin-antitoxin system HicB family antitoxin [Dehalococcoidia bacterium]
MKLTVQVHNDEDGGFWAEVAEIPGCITQGDTVEELEANLREVIEMSLEGLIQDYVDSLKGPSVEIEPGDATWTMAVTLGREVSRANA